MDCVVNICLIYYQSIDNLLFKVDPNAYPQVINDWAKHKKQDIIRCGLHQPSSAMSKKVWEQIEAHTNSCEQTHYKSNSYGRWLTLLRAIHA